MGPLRRDHGQLSADRAQALDHPIRLRILELFSRNTAMPLEVALLAAMLDADFPEVKIRNVSYHLAILKDAQLVP